MRQVTTRNGSQVFRTPKQGELHLVNIFMIFQSKQFKKDRPIAICNVVDPIRKVLIQIRPLESSDPKIITCLKSVQSYGKKKNNLSIFFLFH
jgi:hypothetical protein